MLKNFEEKNPKYKCACCGIHVKRAALVVAIVEAMRTMAFQVISMGAWSLGTCEDRENTMCVYMNNAVVYGTVICALFGLYTIVSLTLLFLGLKCENANFVVPHIVAQALWLMYMVIMAGFYLIWGRGNGILYLLSVLYVINFGFEVWFVLITVKCWEFFRVKHLYVKTMFFSELEHPLYRTTKNIVLSPLVSDPQSSSPPNGMPTLSLNLKTDSEW